jgi:hypothetical protein
MMFRAFVINVEISTNRLTPYLSEDRDSSYYHTQLSLYDSHEADTVEKKQECFLNGLNDGLAYALEA